MESEAEGPMRKKRQAADAAFLDYGLNDFSAEEAETLDYEEWIAQLEDSATKESGKTIP